MTPSIDFSPSGMTEEQVKEHVMEQVVSGSHFNGLTNSIELASGTTWGDPSSWYKSSGSKFDWKYATIRTEDLLKLHNLIDHNTDNANSDTVEWVVDCKENDNMDEVPTPVLAMEPVDFGSDPISYTPVREGRSRAVGAKKAGIKRIPILISVRRARL